MKYFVTIVIVLVAATTIVGLFVVGSPEQERLRRFDATRINNLQFVQSEIVAFWQNKQTLPPSLDALKDDIRGIIIPTDPVTKQPYEYSIKGPETFVLCANFAVQSDSAGMDSYSYPHPAYPGYVPVIGEGQWNHDTGNVCFERTIDKDRYTPTDLPR